MFGPLLSPVLVRLLLIASQVCALADYFLVNMILRVRELCYRLIDDKLEGGLPCVVELF